MAFTYGFYDSVNHDRVYNAEQFGAIFEGIIRDGVYSTVGNHLTVVKNETVPMTVNVRSGRAWFKGTWSYNDTEYVLELDDSELLLNRIDAVVLEIDHTTTVRANSLKVIKGTPASSPIRPTMEHSLSVDQYPLAYIYIGVGVEDIAGSDITNAVGTEECPFVTGVLQQTSIDDLYYQWQSSFTEWNDAKRVEFEEWLSHLQDELDDNQAAHLQRQIDEVKDTREITILSSAWTQDTTINSFVFTATIPGMTEDGEPDVWPKRENAGDVDDINEAFGYIYKGVTASDQVTFYATERPTIDLVLFVKGVY